MSKIYRRPMFRGGGPVSSYGNGITAPLVPGYQGGGQIGGGIIYGKPMADGRYGFETSSLKPQLPEAQPNKYLEMITNMFNKEDDQITTGGELLSKYNNVAPDGVPKGVVIDNGQPKEINKKNSFEFKKKKEEDLRTDSDRTADPKSASDGLDYLGDGITDEMLNVDINTVDMKDVLVDVLVDGKIVKVKKSDTKLVSDNADGSLGTVTRVLLESAKPNNAELPKNMKSFPRDVKEMGVDSEIDNIITNPNNENNILATTEVSAEDAMKENQELFKKLLGSKKARGQDISDMLLRFSGSDGNTIGEKFKNYTKAESAAGPGRSEKINQTASALAINDYVAGKRSKEQGELLTKKIDYELSAKDKYLTPQEGDSNSVVLAKIARANKIDPSSNRAVKQLLKFKLKRSDIYGITTDPMKKNLAKKLKVGINIVTDKGGAKTIFEKKSDGSVTQIPFDGI